MQEPGATTQYRKNLRIWRNVFHIIVLSSLTQLPLCSSPKSSWKEYLLQMDSVWNKESNEYAVYWLVLYWRSKKKGKESLD